MGRTPEVTTAQVPGGRPANRRAEPASGPMVSASGLLDRLERLHLGLGVEMGRRHADRLECPAAVADAEKRLRLEPPRARPAAPLLLDVGGGVYQDAVEIEQDSGAFEAFHAANNESRQLIPSVRPAANSGEPT